MVTDEREPSADDHRAGELGRQVREHAPERTRGPASRTRRVGNYRRGRANPQAPGGATAVALPVGRIVVEASKFAGEQSDRVSPAAVGGGTVASRAIAACAQRQVGYRAERQRPFCTRAARQRGRQHAGLDVVKERLVRRTDGQYLPGRSPAADPGPRRAPVGEPGAGPVGEAGHVDLRAAVLGADPGHMRAVRRQPRRRRLCLLRGEAPGPAAGERRQPDVVSSDEHHQVVGDMRESEVSRRRHRAIVRPVPVMDPDSRGAKALPGAADSATCSDRRWEPGDLGSSGTGRGGSLANRLPSPLGVLAHERLPMWRPGVVTMWGAGGRGRRPGPRRARSAARA